MPDIIEALLKPLPKPPRADSFVTGGELNALAKLDQLFVNGEFNSYTEENTKKAHGSGTQLSVYLSHGCITISQILQMMVSQGENPLLRKNLLQRKYWALIAHANEDEAAKADFPITLNFTRYSNSFATGKLIYLSLMLPKGKKLCMVILAPLCARLLLRS
jgi:deoxyribodipyrimidine photolyase